MVRMFRMVSGTWLFTRPMARRFSRWAARVPPLEMPGEHKQLGQYQAQDGEQAPAPAPQDPQNPQQFAGVRQHPHDSVGIQSIDGVPVVDEH